MTIKELLIKKIEAYKRDNNLNTSTMRGKKIHGVAHVTIYSIVSLPNYEPSKPTIRKLLEGFKIEFKEVDSYKCFKEVRSPKPQE